MSCTNMSKRGEAVKLANTSFWLSWMLLSFWTIGSRLQWSQVVTTRRLTFWWWAPTVSNVIFSFLLVLYYGGDEKRFIVRLLSCLPCMWVNIFFFVDSPYKRRAAKSISMWLELRFLLEVFLLPLLVCWAVASKNAWDDLHMIISTHTVMFGSMVLCLLTYFCLWIFMQYKIIGEIDLIDIFTVSEKGNKERMKEAVETLVAEVRELTRSASAEIDLNKPDVDGNTLLMLAARQGHAELCDFLVKQGAFISITQKGQKSLRNWSKATWQDWTALHMAARHGKDEVIGVLIDNGALKENRHYLDAKGQTPLHIAVSAKQVQAAAILANKCPDWTSAQDLKILDHSKVLIYCVYNRLRLCSWFLGIMFLERSLPVLYGSSQALASFLLVQALRFCFEDPADTLKDLRGRTPLDLANAQLREILTSQPSQPGDYRHPSTESLNLPSCPRLYSRRQGNGVQSKFIQVP